MRSDDVPISDDDKKFEAAFNSILHIDKKDYPCYVGGLKIASGNEFVVRSPIDDSIQFGRFQEPENGLADRAADAASDAFKTWSATDPLKRADIFENILNTIIKQRYRIASAVTVSSGMIRDDALYEVDRLTEVIENGIEEIRKGIKGKPLGAWAIISEYNSPLAAPIGYAVSAMLAGNTVVVIPPKECPYPVYMMYEFFTSAALPDGVLNVIFDRKGTATNALTENEKVKGIVAVGRSDRFEDLMFAAVDDELSFIGEFKGMNPLIVHRPQSMQAAAEITLASAFGYTGQRMDSCSKVIITAVEQKQFTDQLLNAVKRIEVGDPAEKGTTVGPIISKENAERFLDIVKKNKDNLVFGGKRIMNDVTDAGYYVMPAIFIGLPEHSELNEMDQSLPILSVQIVNDLDEAIEAANNCEFGTSMGILSKDEKIIEKVLTNASSDVVYVNGTSRIVGTAVKADVSRFM